MYSIDILQKLVASFAFLVGGVWVLMNYVRNRTHVPRLQIELTAQVLRCDSRYYLLVRCAAKNVGLSKISLSPQAPDGVGGRGTALLVEGLRTEAGELAAVEAPWEEEISAFDIFGENDGSIEPALTISEEKLILLGTPVCDAYRLKLRVSAHNRRWIAVAVAAPRAEREGS